MMGRRIDMADPNSPSPPRSALAWISDAIRHRGMWGAIRHYSSAGFDLLRDLAPQRRRSRYGDIDFDFDHQVDTTWATVSVRTRLREFLSGCQYQASEPELFREILRALPVSLEGFTFVDLGSGKGRTLLMASDFPFHRILGVELLNELHQIASNNIATYRGEQQRCFSLEAQCEDAREFQFPPEPLVLYLFNPFPEYGLRTVLANLHASLVSIPRETYVIYHNLVHEEIFRSQPWLREVYRTRQFAIYRAE